MIFYFCKNLPRSIGYSNPNEYRNSKQGTYMPSDTKLLDISVPTLISAKYIKKDF